MSIEYFLKKNKKTVENTFYPATKSLLDENGNPVLWEIKALTSKEMDEIREQCTTMVSVPGKKGIKEPQINTSLLATKILCACVVTPNLYSQELQDSYGVMTPEELIKEMVDNAGEYSDFQVFVQDFSGLNIDVNEEVEEIKN